MDIKQYLQSGKRLIFDGAMGTMLQRKGLPAGMIPEEVNFLHPEWLIDIHREYLAAGAQVITTFRESPNGFPAMYSRQSRMASFA